VTGTIFQRRRRPALLVRRTVLGLLLVLSLILLTLSYRESAVVSSLRVVAMEAVQPIEKGLTRAWSPVQGAFDWCSDLIHATSDKSQLEERNAELEAQLANQRATEAENSRFREILALKERGKFPDGYDTVTATVIGRSPTSIDNSIAIGVGSNDGIKVNDPVMVTRGLIGRVEAVSPNAARVGLIINREQAVSAVVVGSEATGVLRALGNEGSPVLQLAYVAQSARVRVGDTVVTSGWSTGELRSIYPRNIPLGIVSSVGSSPADLYKTVQVTPFADFDRIDEVMVLVANQPLEAYVEPTESKTTLPRKDSPTRSAAKKRASTDKQKPEA
jgi:rod shape-determining protein MreC